MFFVAGKFLREAVTHRSTSEVEHVLATSTLPQKKSKNMLVHVGGPLLPGVTSKDIVLHVCGVIG